MLKDVWTVVLVSKDKKPFEKDHEIHWLCMIVPIIKHFKEDVSSRCLLLPVLSWISWSDEHCVYLGPTNMLLQLTEIRQKATVNFNRYIKSGTNG